MKDWKEFDDFVAEELAPDLTIVRPLGRGSVANVYLANDRALARQVAVKVLAPKHARDDTTRRRFQREAKAAARIKHNNVTSVFAVDQLSNGVPYQVMEYVDGRNLEDSLAARRLSLEDAKDVLKQLASGLAAAHAQQIVHRDVKPANVLHETGTGRVVLTDFGLAAARDRVEDTTRLTMFGQVLGDLPYVSPEHLSGQELTELADIYALGVLGYHLVAGRGPYEATSAAEMTMAHLKEEPLRLASLRPEVEPGLADLLFRCLAKRPQQRPTAADIVQELEGGASTAPPEKEEPRSAWAQFLIELKRRQVYKVGATYIAFLVVLIGVLGGLQDIELGLPEPVRRAIIGLTLAGLPVSLALSWMFDLRAGRIERTLDDVAPGVVRDRVIPTVALVLSLVLAVLLWFGIQAMD